MRTTGVIWKTSFYTRWRGGHVARLSVACLKSATRYYRYRGWQAGHKYNFEGLRLRVLYFDRLEDAFYVTKGDFWGLLVYWMVTAWRWLCRRYYEALRWCARRGWLDANPGDILTWRDLKPVVWVRARLEER